jgi:hypothetical protein
MSHHYHLVVEAAQSIHTCDPAIRLGCSESASAFLSASSRFYGPSAIVRSNDGK